MMIKRTILAFAVALVLPAPASAQFGSSDIVDRLVAVVGDSVVVHTQVEEEIQRMKLGGNTVPEPGAPQYDAFYRSVLNQFVDRLLILQAAAKDSLIQVDEATIDENVSDRLVQLTQQFGGQPAFQAALAAEALTLAEYRELLRHEARTEQIQQLYFQLNMRRNSPIDLSEEELLSRFQEASGRLQQRPRLLTFRQVVLEPESSADAMDAARDEAQALLDRINAGEDFAELATAHSDDPGTASLGGDLGWFRRGRMVREFEDVAFSLLDGQVSDLVQTEYGYHIIKVERYRPGERSARHILIMPEKTAADLDRAREVAGDVMARAQAGESMKDLFAEFSDPAAPDSVTIAFEQLGELPPPYAQLSSATTGDFIGPLEYDAGGGQLRFAVVLVEEIREAGAYTFEDLRGQLADALQQEKQIDRILSNLRANTHIDIRM